MSAFKMTEVSIYDLVRELNVNSSVILATLKAIGFREHKTRSSMIDGDLAERVRHHLHGETPTSAQPR